MCYGVVNRIMRDGERSRRSHGFDVVVMTGLNAFLGVRSDEDRDCGVGVKTSQFLGSRSDGHRN